jgi:hypothetical protein
VVLIYAGEKVFDVTVIFEPSARQQPEAVGRTARLQFVGRADAFARTGGGFAGDWTLRNSARRSTAAAITCNPAGRDVSSFVAEAKKGLMRK